MISMKHTVLPIAAAFLTAAAVSAQNLNPQVQVTNDYETRMSEVRKNTLLMAVPDSATLFRTEVDYSVFETPYKGAYDFTPYAVKLTPKLRGFDVRRLYVRAGAGYSFHPELQAVFSPIRKGLTRISVYQDLNGYSGRLHSVDGARFDGRDLAENFGVEGRWNKERFDMTWKADYLGLFTKDDRMSGKFHDINLDARIVSNEADSTLFYYSLRAGLGFAFEDCSAAPFLREPMSYFVDATIGPVIDFRYKLLVDFHMQQSSYSGIGYDPLALTFLRPRVEMEFGPLQVSGGVFLSLGHHLFLRPDLRLNALLFGDRLGVYAEVKGEEHAWDYSHYKREDHWFSPLFTGAFRSSYDEIKARLGVRGMLKGKFQYDLNGGWGFLTDMPVYALQASAADPARYDRVMRYADYHHAWVQALASWNAPRLEVDGRLCWNKTDISDAYLDLPAVTADVRGRYNWNRRIFAGASVEAASRRYSAFCPVKGYVNLSLEGEYRFNRRTAAWARIGNLLGMEISRSPLHMEKGPYFTLGLAFGL